MKNDLLDLYTDYLLSSFGPTTATGLATLLDGQVSHDQITRWLADEPKTSRDLWLKVKESVRQIESDDATLTFDDSIEEKPYTDENELICWHWDASRQCAVKGINFVTAFYQTERAGFPVVFELVTKTEWYTDTKTGKLKRRSAVTKNVRFRRMLHICVHNQLRFRYVLADTWYASADNMKYVKREMGKDFIFSIKCNRKVAVSADDKSKGKYSAVERLDLSESEPRQVWLEELDFPVLLAKQVFTNDDGSRGVRYLVTSDLTLTWKRLTTLFKKRWGVEVYHKSLKQNASLEKSPTRTPTTQRNHFFAALCAYIKLERIKLENGLGHFQLKSKIYLSALKTAYAELVKLKLQVCPA